MEGEPSAPRQYPPPPPLHPDPRSPIPGALSCSNSTSGTVSCKIMPVYSYYVGINKIILDSNERLFKYILSLLKSGMWIRFQFPS